MMSGRPYTYSRGMAIAQLMRDNRRPAIKEIEKKKPPYNRPRTVYLYGEDLFTAYSDTIDWVPKLSKLSKYGREIHYMTQTQIDNEHINKPLDWANREITPIDGWPTEEEIEACIAESAELEKSWDGSLSTNDISAFAR